MTRQPQFDWSRFLVHFFFGAIIGAALGLGFWAKSAEAGSPSHATGIIYLGGGALIFGVIAGFFGDRFWRGIGDLFRTL